VPYIFKASYDKANRSSVKSYRGPGLLRALPHPWQIKGDLHLPILTIFMMLHRPRRLPKCGHPAIPAFLSRHRSACCPAKTGRIVNVKKAQFLSPWDMGNVTRENCRDRPNSRLF